MPPKVPYYSLNFGMPAAKYISCDFTPLDYFLWVYVKALVYVDKPQTLEHFEDNIRRDITDIRPQMLEKVIENWKSRLDYIRASRGSHMPEIIFKISPPEALRNINFCVVQSIAKLPTGLSKMMPTELNSIDFAVSIESPF
ncbi:transposable element Tc3 transposase [Trichonephila clavipes]|uniref:Transposable element Tc3 transposase n=1 Tax=Trichonephila clavipes TaxID=2585209 RepID=A0A8X6RJ24_TRICX|nr:transposable element Tc3 transposase [Trichonephila clavipes]